MRKKIIIGNWKMNKDYKTAISFVEKLSKDENVNKLDMGIASPFIWLKDLQQIAKNKIIISAQNCYYEKDGAYTGEISVEMLKNINISYIIIGHSERREIFGETDELINQKNKKILESGLISVVCCGETLKQYEKNETKKIIEKQIEQAYKGIKKELVKKSIIAYEPIWAIGTGKTATPLIAQNICSFIREKIKKLYDKETSEQIRIQYGGSVNDQNSKEILSQNDIDGALVGGASLEIEKFTKLIKNSI